VHVYATTRQVRPAHRLPPRGRGNGVHSRTAAASKQRHGLNAIARLFRSSRMVRRQGPTRRLHAARKQRGGGPMQGVNARADGPARGPRPRSRRDSPADPSRRLARRDSVDVDIDRSARVPHARLTLDRTCHGTVGSAAPSAAMRPRCRVARAYGGKFIGETSAMSSEIRSALDGEISGRRCRGDIGAVATGAIAPRPCPAAAASPRGRRMASAPRRKCA